MAVEMALVVDDSKSARVMLSRLLKQKGINVAFAESAEEAFDYLKGDSPDLIFMDHMMPGMDGLHAAKLISENNQTAHIPVVMYTSKEGQDYLAEAKEYGAFGVVMKPANSKVVARVIGEVNELMLNRELESTQLQTELSVQAQTLPTMAVESKQKEAGSQVQEKASVDQHSHEALEALVAEAVSSRIHSIVNGLKVDLYDHIQEEYIRPLKKEIVALKKEVEDLPDLIENQNKARQQIGNLKKLLREQESKVIDLEYFASGYPDKFVLRENLASELEGMREDVQKQISRHVQPFEAAMSHKLNLLDPQRDEYDEFVKQLYVKIYPQFQSDFVEPSQQNGAAEGDKSSPELNAGYQVHLATVLSVFSFLGVMAVLAIILIQQA